MYKIRLARWGFFKNRSKRRAAKLNARGGAVGAVAQARGGAEDNNNNSRVNPPRDETVCSSGTEEASVGGSDRRLLGRVTGRSRAGNSATTSKGTIKRMRSSTSSSNATDIDVQEQKQKPGTNASPPLEMSMAWWQDSLPARLTDTPQERRALSIFHCVRAWERPGTARRTGTGSRSGSGSCSHTAPPPAPDAFASTEMYRSFGLAATLWTRGQGRLAGKAVRRAFLLAEEALRDPVEGVGVGVGGDAMLMWNVVDVVNEMCHWRQGRLLRLFLRHLEAMAACRAPRHPVRAVARDLLLAASSSSRGGVSGCDDNGACDDGGGDELAEVAERAWRCNLDRVRLLFGAEEERVQRLVEGVSTAEAKRGHGGDGTPTDGIVVRGIMEWVRSSELLRRPLTPSNPYNPLPGQKRWETRVWYVTVAAYATWSSITTTTTTATTTSSSSPGSTTIPTQTRGDHHHEYTTTWGCTRSDPPKFADDNYDDSAYYRDVFDLYVRKARLRALVDAREFESAEPIAEKVLQFTDDVRYHPQRRRHRIEAIVARWAFEDLLWRIGKTDEARRIRHDNLLRVERFLADIPDRLP